MAKKPEIAQSTPPRKRRTREHIIADLSVNFVERFIFESGCAAIRPTADYGYDLFLETYDDEGYPEPGVACMQLKATDDLGRFERDGSLWVQLDMRDCRRWLEEIMPVFVVLFDAVRKRAWWLDVQAYFREHSMANSQANSVRAQIAMKNSFTRRTIRQMRRIKIEAARAAKRGPDWP